jgi:hypothetical protein
MSERDRLDPAWASGPERLGAVFEDLEQQAAGIHLAERDAELADRVRGEYATVTFASRVHASLDRDVALTLTGGEVAEGRLAGAGVDWCLVAPAEGRAVWLVRLDAVAVAYGLSARAVPEAARPALARLGFGSALHRLAEESPLVRLHAVSGGSVPVRVMRIGADFVEAQSTSAAATSTSLLVPFSAIRAVRAG